MYKCIQRLNFFLWNAYIFFFRANIRKHESFAAKYILTANNDKLFFFIKATINSY